MEKRKASQDREKTRNAQDEKAAQELKAVCVVYARDALLLSCLDSIVWCRA